jgi:hypothetical protein
VIWLLKEVRRLLFELRPQDNVVFLRPIVICTKRPSNSSHNHQPGSDSSRFRCLCQSTFDPTRTLAEPDTAVFLIERQSTQDYRVAIFQEPSGLGAEPELYRPVLAELKQTAPAIAIFR